MVLDRAKLVLANTLRSEGFLGCRHFFGIVGRIRDNIAWLDDDTCVYVAGETTRAAPLEAGPPSCQNKRVGDPVDISAWCIKLHQGQSTTVVLSRRLVVGCVC
jgi:hypothetical protein